MGRSALARRIRPCWKAGDVIFEQGALGDDFFLLAEQGILVVIPEPSSIENAYRFLKMSFYRHLWRSLKASPARKVVEEAMDQKNQVGIRTPFDLLEAVERLDAASGRFLKEKALEFRPRLLVNQVRYPEDPDAPANQVEIVSILSEDWVMR